jgi:hypothetical protein
MNYIILNGAEPVKISDEKAEFIDKILNESEAKSIASELSLIHELALYTSETPLYAREKSALWTLKTVIEKLNGET